MQVFGCRVQGLESRVYGSILWKRLAKLLGYLELWVLEFTCNANYLLYNVLYRFGG